MAYFGKVVSVSTADYNLLTGITTVGFFQYTNMPGGCDVKEISEKEYKEWLTTSTVVGEQEYKNSQGIRHIVTFLE